MSVDELTEAVGLLAVYQRHTSVLPPGKRIRMVALAAENRLRELGVTGFKRPSPPLDTGGNPARVA